MMKKLQLIDMTLRRTQADGARDLTFKEKLEIARRLDRRRGHRPQPGRMIFLLFLQ